ncbi:MAG: zinc ABC transporter substrate-binding protein [Desulfurococcales archaeon]|nr:zinc ABC transporter substrate-binding protein [Desulfurococcales archaeon]
MHKASYVASILIIVSGALSAAAPADTAISRGLVVVATFPGIEEELERLACSDDIVVTASFSADPHSPAVRPSFARALERADVIILMAHTRLDELAEVIGGDATKINVEEYSIELAEIGGTPITHYPIYDPINYASFLREVAESMSAKRPECAAHYRAVAEELASTVMESYKRLNGSLSGKPAIVSSALAANAVGWLGLDIKAIISMGPESQVSPRILKEAEEALAHGAIAVVMTDDRGKPLGRPSEWLLEKAEEYNTPIILVETPFSQGSLASKIEQVAMQAASISHNP